MTTESGHIMIGGDGIGMVKGSVIFPLYPIDVYTLPIEHLNVVLSALYAISVLLIHEIPVIV